MCIRDSLDALLFEVLDGLFDVLAAEGGYDLAVIGNALRDLTAQVARDKGRGFFKDHVEEVGPVAAGELKHVAEAAGGEKGSLCALALCQSVDDGGSAVEKGGDTLIIKDVYKRQALSSSIGAVEKLVILVWMKSCLISVISMPQAENTEAATGTMTLRIFSSFASGGPCIGPPPPKATIDVYKRQI